MGLDHCTIRQHAPLGDDDNAVADHIAVRLRLPHLALVGDPAVSADAAVLVDDGAVDDAAWADAEVGDALLAVELPLRLQLQAVGPAGDGVAEHGVAADPRPLA